MYCSISRPNLPVRGILRKISPIEMCTSDGKLAEHGPLGPLAAAWHPEEENRAVLMVFFHDRDSSSSK